MQKPHRSEAAPRPTRLWRTKGGDKINRRRQSSALPADVALGFAKAVRQHLGGSLYCCEESFPHEGPNSVLYVVVERDAALWRDRLVAIHHDFFGNGRNDSLATAQLEVVDRLTHDALQRMIAGGLIARTTRSSRSLWPTDASTTMPPPLSEAEREKAGSYRCQAARKLKMAGVLASGDLGEEARLALLDAIEPLGRALAVENRIPEPQSLEDALLPPLGNAWKGALPLVRNFLRESSQPVPPILSVLGEV